MHVRTFAVPLLRPAAGGALALALSAHTVHADEVDGFIKAELQKRHIPALVPKPAQPIEDKEPEVAALLRDCMARIPDWKIAVMFLEEE
jgi:hypothetical protein